MEEHLTKPLKESFSRSKNSTLLPLSRAKPKKSVFQAGIAAFKDGNYINAESLFTKALKCDSTNIKILDARAATFEKLNRLKDSLNDGKKIMQIKPASPTGYLRVGKVHRLLSQSEKALKIYQIAKSKVNRSTPDYEQISQFIKEINSQLAKKQDPIKQDPIVLLPSELLLNIFYRIPFRRICTCTRVSKLWRGWLTTATPLWQSIDVNSLSRTSKVTNAVVENLVLRSKGMVRQILLGDAQKITDNILIAMVRQRCMMIERIELQYQEGVKAEGLTFFMSSAGKCLKHLDLKGCMAVTDSSVEAILKHCPNLEHLNISFSNFISPKAFLGNEAHPLRELIFEDSQATDLHLDFISTRFKTLTKLSIAITGLSHDIEYPTISSRGLLSLQQIPTLSHLNLTGLAITKRLSAIDPPFGTALTTVFKSCTNFEAFCCSQSPLLTEEVLSVLIENSAKTLSMLDLGWCRCIGDEMLKFLAENKPPLTTLLVSSCPSVTDHGIIALVKTCATTLNTLEVARNNGITDISLKAISEHAKVLENLDISGSTVSGNGVKMLFPEKISQRRLKILKLDECANVDIEAVKIARERIVESGWVSFTF